KPATVVAESRVEKVAMVPFPPTKPAKTTDQFVSAAVKSAAKPAPTSEVASPAFAPAPVARANVSADDLLNQRRYLQGPPTAGAPARSRRGAPATGDRRRRCGAVAAH